MSKIYPLPIKSPEAVLDDIIMGKTIECMFMPRLIYDIKELLEGYEKGDVCVIVFLSSGTMKLAPIYPFVKKSP